MSYLPVIAVALSAVLGGTFVLWRNSRSVRRMALGMAADHSKRVREEAKRVAQNIHSEASGDAARADREAAERVENGESLADTLRRDGAGG